MQSMHHTKVRNGNRPLMIILAIIGLSLLLVIANFGPGTAQRSDEAVIAVINNEAITKDEFVNRLIELYGEATMQQMIDELLLSQAIEAGNVNVTDADVQALVDELKLFYPGDPAWNNPVAVKEIERQAYFQIGLERLLAEEVAVSDEELDELYEAQGAQFGDADEQAVRDYLRTQLENQKFQFAASNLFVTLRQEAAAEFFLKDHDIELDISL